MTVPNWLAQASSASMRDRDFPLKDILRDSLYYPACHFANDGNPVKYLAGCVLSFVYVDCNEYGDISRNSLEQELNDRGFRGYKCIGRRKVAWDELFLNRCTRTPRSAIITQQLDEGWRRKLPSLWNDASFFCDWRVFERKAQYERKHGPRRFSWLYICTEGVQTFLRLYVDNSLTPKAVAVIQSGWPELFEDSSGLFVRCVLDNPAGHPQMLLLGGGGELDQFRESLWPGYRTPCKHEWKCIQSKISVDLHDGCGEISVDAYFTEPDIGTGMIKTNVTVGLRDSRSRHARIGCE